ncbi:hypothetical protein [Azospirillum sp. sgz302134]
MKKKLQATSPAQNGSPAANAGKRWVMSDGERSAFVSAMQARGIGLSMKENAGVSINDVIKSAERAAASSVLVTGNIKKTSRTA